MKQWIPIAYDHALSVVSILDSPETSQKSNRSKAVGTNIHNLYHSNESVDTKYL